MRRITLHQRLTAATAIVVLVSAGLACSLLRPKSPLTWQLVLQVGAAGRDRDATTSHTAIVIERRLYGLGVSGFEVQPQGDRILIKLPNVPDRERLKKIITDRGRLELVAVISPSSPAPVQTYDTKEEAVASLGSTVPANRRVLPYPERDKPAVASQNSGSQTPERWVVVESPAIVDGADLRNAEAVQSPASVEDYQIHFSLKAAGAEKFGPWTGSNINKYIGVVLNDEVKSIAYIKGQIFDQGEITGRFTKQSAEDIAHGLNSGALPAPVRIVEEGTIK